MIGRLEGPPYLKIDNRSGVWTPNLNRGGVIELEVGANRPLLELPTDAVLVVENITDPCDCDIDDWCNCNTTVVIHRDGATGADCGTRIPAGSYGEVEAGDLADDIVEGFTEVTACAFCFPRSGATP